MKQKQKTSANCYTHVNQKGILHYVLPLIFIVLFGVVGVGYYVISHAATGTPEIVVSEMPASDTKWCINDDNNSATVNNAVDSAICSGATGQKWSYTDNVIKNTALSGTRCLETQSGGTTAGTRIVSATCTSSSAEQWTHTKTPGVFENVAASKGKKTGECLAAYGGVLGAQLRINTCNASYGSQNWSAATYNPPTTSTPPTTPPTTGSGGGGTTTTSSEHIISTLYAYPTESSWAQVEAGAPIVKYAIVNICAPDGTGSGCGSPADAKNPVWVATIQALEKEGITPLYYISTNYGAEPLATVESELQNAKTWYGISSPMFDTTSTNNPSYYQSLYNYAVNLGATAVVFNPGTIPPQSYMFGSKEIIQVFEGTTAGFEGTMFPSWMSNYPAGEFAATLSVGTSSTVGKDVTDAVKDHIGNFYEDDEPESPNYATLPSFWSTELSDVEKAQ